jgi:hypothetical protein
MCKVCAAILEYPALCRHGTSSMNKHVKGPTYRRSTKRPSIKQMIEDAVSSISLSILYKILILLGKACSESYSLHLGWIGAWTSKATRYVTTSFSIHWTSGVSWPYFFCAPYTTAPSYSYCENDLSPATRLCGGTATEHPTTTTGRLKDLISVRLLDVSLLIDLYGSDWLLPRPWLGVSGGSPWLWAAF